MLKIKEEFAVCWISNPGNQPPDITIADENRFSNVNDAIKYRALIISKTKKSKQAEIYIRIVKIKQKLQNESRKTT